MKFKKWATAMLATASVLTLAACGNSKDSGKKSDGDSDKIVTEVKKDTTVTFWHAMNGVQEEALTKIADDFMKENSNIKIELQNQSSYSDLQAKINSTLPSPDDLPTISQAYPGWLYGAAKDNMLVDLTPYMEDKTIGWGDQEKIKDSLLAGAEIEGTQYGIPFNKSTEVLVYNKDMFDEYGVEVPTTMEEYKEACKTIWEKSNHTVVGGGFDSLNNYYAIGMENKGVELTKDLKLTDKDSVDLVNYYNEGIKEGYFRIAGSDKYLSGPFANSQVATFIGSMAGEGYVAKDTEGKFEYGVAPRPDKKNIQQGTDVYMFDSATGDEKTAAFLFMKYLATPDVQLYWANQTGYMPILDSVIDSDDYKNSETIKTPAILEDATKDLFAIPVVENADPAYNEIRTIMEKVFSDPSQDVKKVLEDSQAQLDAAWNQ